MSADTGAAPGTSSVEAGMAALQQGNRGAARKHFAQALRTDPSNVQAHHFAGGLAFEAGQYKDALEHFEAACRLDPRGAIHQFNSAVTLQKLNQPDAAQRRCEATLALDPAFEPAHSVLAALTLRGPWYLDIMSMIHVHVHPRTYIEIGVESGQSLALALPETRAIGVDPEPKISVPLGPQMRVVAERSDDYFASHDVQAELGGLPIDLAFIDGMHQFEFALRDFMNLERLSSPTSTVLVHDCFPLSRLTAERDRRTTFWSGDIWRLILLLKRHRPDLAVDVIATAPTGLGVIRRLDPGSRVLHDRYQEIVREFLAIDYSALETDKRGMLGLFPNDWERIKTILQ
ncbi:MAG TPA: tetratricopeptide repeat protein [Burkholderiales bacterium]|nr:tetratricopeptide repeat protein [Burkholderiales bacterium]